MAVSVDSPEELTIMRKASEASFPFLSDADGRLMDLLDVRHEEGMPGKDIAQSASFLLTPDGKILWVHLAQNYRQRPLPRDILAAIDQRLGS